MWKKIIVSLVGMISTMSLVYAIQGNLQASSTYRPFNMNLGSSFYFTSPNKENQDTNGTAQEWLVLANDFPGKTESSDYVSLMTRTSIGATSYGDPNNYGTSNPRTLINTTFNTSTLTAQEQALVKRQSAQDAGGAPLFPEVEDANGDFAILPSPDQLAPLDAMINDSGSDINKYGGKGTGAYFNTAEERNEVRKKVITPTDFSWTRRLGLAGAGQMVVWLPNEELSFFGSIGYRGSADVLTILKLEASNLALATPLSDDTGVNYIDIRRPSKGAQLSSVSSDMKMKLALKNPSVSLSIGELVSQPGSILNVDYTLQNASLGENKFINAVFTQDKDGVETVVYAGRVSNTNASSFVLALNDIPAGTYGVRFFYEEVSQGQTNYNIASEVTDKVDIVVVDKLKSLDFEEEPKGNLSYYKYNTNVNANDTLGEITVQRNSGKVTFDLIAPSTGNDIANLLEIVTENGKNTITTKNSLDVGVYNFRISAYDSVGYPLSLINNAGDTVTCKNSDGVEVPCLNSSGSVLTAALISEDYTIVVYPNEDQLDYRQSKNGNKYYSLSQINTNDYDLGTIEFADDAGIDTLLNAGYKVKDVQLVQPGTTTLLSNLQVSANLTDPGLFYMKKKGTQVSGNTNFDIVVTFQNTETSQTTISLRKENLSFLIPNEIQFINTTSDTFNTTGKQEITYDSINSYNNAFVLKATDATQAIQLNAAMKYCVLKADKSACDTSENAYLAIAPNTIAGTSKVSIKPPGTENRSASIRAYLEDSYGTTLGYKDLDIIIHPSVQKLSWSGVNIQSSGNDVVVATSNETLDNHPTWKISLKYDRDVSSNNIFSFASYFAEGIATNGTFGLISTVSNKSGASNPQVTYHLECTDPNDASLITLDPITGSFTITGKFNSEVRIIASAAGTGNYAPTVNDDDTTTTDINEDGSATLLLQVDTKPKVVFTPSSRFTNATALITDDFATGKESFGTLSVDTTSASLSSYKIKEVAILNQTQMDLTGQKVWDKQSNTNAFTLTKASGTYADQLYARYPLSVNTYKVSIVGMNTSEEIANQIDVEINVKKVAFDVSTMKWQKAVGSGALSNVGGSIDSTTFLNSDSFNERYHSSDVWTVNIVDSTQLSDATIVYSLEDVDTEGSIKLTNANNGTFQTKKKSIDNSKVQIKATITKTNYETCIVYLPIQIQPGLQYLNWVGKDIQTTGNKIEQDGSSRNWKLSLKLEEAQGSSSVADQNTYNTSTLYKGGTVQSKTIYLQSNVEEESHNVPALDVTYTISYEQARDSGNVEYENGRLTILNKLYGDVYIKAESGLAGNYAGTLADDVSTPTVNEDGSATLVVSVSDRAKVDFTPSFENEIRVGDELATGASMLGKLTIKPYTETNFQYQITSVKQWNKALSNANPDGEVIYDTLVTTRFSIKGINQDELYVNNTPLSEGSYYVTVKGTRTVNGIVEEATEKVVEIIVKNANLDLTKFKWQSKGSSFVNVGGSIPTDTGLNSKALDITFEDKGVFYVNVSDIAGSNLLTGATVTYKVKDNSATIISLQDASTGKFTTISASSGTPIQIQATIHKEGYNDVDVYLPININKALAAFQFSKADGSVYDLKDANDSSKYKAIDVTYKQGEPLDLFTQKAPNGTDVSIRIQSNGASKGNDVLKFSDFSEGIEANDDSADKLCVIGKDDYATKNKSQCAIEIENALNSYFANRIQPDNDEGKIIVIASTSATDNYAAQTIQIPVNVKQTNQDSFAFARESYSMYSNANGTFMPVFQDTSGTGKIELSLSSDVNEPDLNANEAFLAPSSNNIKYQDGIDSFGYNILVEDGKEPISFHIYAQKKADRNYRKTGFVSALVNILPEDQNLFKVKVESHGVASTPTSFVTYGDNYFKILASNEDDAIEVDDDGAPLYSYTYEISEEYKSYLKQGDAINEYIPLKAGNAQIKIMRTSASGTNQTMNYKFSIMKKTIKLQVADVEKLVGQKLVSSDLNFTSSSDAFLASDVSIIGPATFTCTNSDNQSILAQDILLLENNNLAIHASYKETQSNRETLANYNIVNLSKPTTVGIEAGQLLISQEESDSTWYEVKPGTKADESSTLKGEDEWYNGPVDIYLRQQAVSDYDLIAPSLQGGYVRDKFSVQQEGAIDHKIYFRQSSGIHKDAIASNQVASIKIDSTAPEIKSITGIQTNKDAISELLNKLTFGKFFKPGVAIDILTTDALSGVSSVDYRIYQIDKTTGYIGSLVKTDTIRDVKENVVSTTIDEEGPYRVCAITKDKAGNISTEKCSDVMVKNLGYDADDDGKADFVDSNEDGCPDINIALKDEKGKIYKINVNRDDDDIPDLNIDSDGDGIAEINVDTDKDGKPDLNLVILTKWEPTFCAKEQMNYEGKPIEYCTMKDIKAVINLDTGNDTSGSPQDGIPDINIDTDGDMKANVNIDKNKNGKLDPEDLNIVNGKITWNPSKDFTKDGFLYDTEEITPLLNVDTGNDNEADINIDLDANGIPDINIDTDGDYTKAELNIDSDGDILPDINLDFNKDGKAEINIDTQGDGIPDLNLDSDGDGIADYNIFSDDGETDKQVIVLTEWNPTVKGKKDNMDFMTMKIEMKNALEDNGITVEKPDGAPFLPNYSIKVNNIKDSISAEEKAKMDALVTSGNEIKDIVDIKMFDGTTEVNPDGNIVVRLPVIDELKGKTDTKLIVEQTDGSYKIIEAKIEDGYVIYETDFLGKVGIVGEKAKLDDKTDIPLPKPDASGGSTPNTSVKGNYTSGIGGAGTGDAHNVGGLMLLSAITTVILSAMLKKSRQ